MPHIARCVAGSVSQSANSSGPSPKRNAVAAASSEAERMASKSSGWVSFAAAELWGPDPNAAWMESRSLITHGRMRGSVRTKPRTPPDQSR